MVAVAEARASGPRGLAACRRAADPLRRDEADEPGGGQRNHGKDVQWKCGNENWRRGRGRHRRGHRAGLQARVGVHECRSLLLMPYERRGLGELDAPRRIPRLVYACVSRRLDVPARLERA